MSTQIEVERRIGRDVVHDLGSRSAVILVREPGAPLSPAQRSCVSTDSGQLGAELRRVALEPTSTTAMFDASTGRGSSATRRR